MRSYKPSKYTRHLQGLSVLKMSLSIQNTFDHLHVSLSCLHPHSQDKLASQDHIRIGFTSREEQTCAEGL